MAVFTPLSILQAARIMAEHGSPEVLAVRPIGAGSVNSNFFVDTPARTFFLRIYEEQAVAGVEYEWSLLEHLERGGVPIPRRVPGPLPGEIRVDDKCVAVFELMPGEMLCQRAVTPIHCRMVGAALGRAHRVSSGFALRRESRLKFDSIQARLRTIPETGELSDVRIRLGSALTEARATYPQHLPDGVIHGDLFRDNVHWEDDQLTGIIDWESASDGVLAFDLMVAVLAWCFDDDFRWELASSLCAGYHAERPLLAAEIDALRRLAIAAAIRFTVTRITDFHLRGSLGDRVHKDYRRFLRRLDIAQALGDREFAARLGLVG